MNSRDTNIAVLGIGQMGIRIVRRLLEASLKVTVWNRTRARAEEVASDGAIVCDTPREAVRDATVVITIVRDGVAVSDVLFRLGTAESLRPGTLVIDMSTIQPRLAHENAQRLAKRDVAYVDAPATGGVTGAEAGTLLIMAGGDPAHVARAAKILSILGRLVVVGKSGAGQLAKIAQQMLMGATAGAFAEAILLAEANNVDPERIVDSIRGGLVHSRALELYAMRVLARDFQSRGAGASLHVKDLESALAEGELSGVELPISQLLHGLYKQLVTDFGDLDKSAIYLPLAQCSRRKTGKATKKPARR